uniref:Uncharacterized protein n=1 Tax=Timema douglasi TaxID=61478 RepID=A0A7R8VUW4_TIMDO|nr:unnamed protein product [Timema douglasi]
MSRLIPLQDRVSATTHLEQREGRRTRWRKDQQPEELRPEGVNTELGSPPLQPSSEYLALGQSGSDVSQTETSQGNSLQETKDKYWGRFGNPGSFVDHNTANIGGSVDPGAKGVDTSSTGKALALCSSCKCRGTSGRSVSSSRSTATPDTECTSHHRAWTGLDMTCSSEDLLLGNPLLTACNKTNFSLTLASDLRLTTASVAVMVALLAAVLGLEEPQRAIRVTLPGSQLPSGRTGDTLVPPRASASHAAQRKWSGTPRSADVAPASTGCSSPWRHTSGRCVGMAHTPPGRGTNLQDMWPDSEILPTGVEESRKYSWSPSVRRTSRRSSGKAGNDLLPNTLLIK